MRSHDAMKSEEASDAAWEAARGGVAGALKWGVGAAVLGAAGYIWSPLYRSMTVQFKVYLQMCGMVPGGMIEADSRLRAYEQRADPKYLKYNGTYVTLEMIIESSV
ncbi:imidazoleglycerol-phosphate dehydratase [Fusarium heterosporum]|uniref:Imidazoleglycerol-phosphate dehydratase n=1 Tax=Fusarium heterosporum TaxID=42747 RepID=A0A8H5WE59_FUSHE|nr:imidazoleglycerol-phosphate dehydratase [Fusarium heterosporum]